MDTKQYSTNGILRYEKIFGRTFVSTGGLDTTKVAPFDLLFLGIYKDLGPSILILFIVTNKMHISNMIIILDCCDNISDLAIFGETISRLFDTCLFQEFVDRLNLKKGEVVLDVGCGIGGSAFYMVKVIIVFSHR